MSIRPLDFTTDHYTVANFFRSAADYVTLETGAAPTRETTTEFFEERPPNLDAKDALHFGLFEYEHLLGVIAFSFGYPEDTDSYIGLLLLSEGARGFGNGKQALAYATSLARARGMRRQLVAVLDENPKGRAFWEREGFVLEKTFPASDDRHIRHRLTRTL